MKTGAGRAVWAIAGVTISRKVSGIRGRGGANKNNQGDGYCRGSPSNTARRSIVSLVSERALGAAAGLKLKAFLPQSTAMADVAERFDGEIAQHGDAAELVGAGSGCVRMELAVGDSYESGLRAIRRVRWL